MVHIIISFYDSPDHEYLLGKMTIFGDPPTQKEFDVAEEFKKAIMPILEKWSSGTLVQIEDNSHLLNPRTKN